MKYKSVYKKWKNDPISFWSNIANDIIWDRFPETILNEIDNNFYEWFPDGKMNTCFNALDRNIEEGRGFTLMGSAKKNIGHFDFASSNEFSRASLDTLDFMPLASANYSGGIVITDWYSENNSPNESVKISVRFLTNEIRSDALDINVYLKKCSEGSSNCSISKNNNDLVADLNLSILKKTN